MTEEQFLALIREVKDKWGRETVAAMVKAIEKQNIKWRGTLKRSVMYEQDNTLDGDIEIHMADYGKYVDEGIGPAGINKRPILKGDPKADRKKIGAIAYHLKPWASSKNLNPFAVATKIAKYGIKPKPFYNSVLTARVQILGDMIIEAQKEYLEAIAKDNSSK